MNGKVYINGQIMEPGEATISVFDRGFLYGDSIYETMRVYEGIPFALQNHLSRLAASGRRVGFEVPWPPEALAKALDETLAASGLTDAYLRLIITRGSGPIGLDPQLALEPQLIVLVLDLPRLPPEMYEKGHSARLVSVPRNLKHALDPQAKTGNYMNSVLALREARGAGADEALMLNHQGHVAESSSSNVFAWLEGTWCTPPVEVGILSGITRATVIEICQENSIPIEERVLWPQDVASAQEIFFSSSVRELVPIVRLDESPIGDGRVGPATKKLMSLFRQTVRDKIDAERRKRAS